MANLTVEAGNFAPAAHSAGDSVKARVLIDFYREMRYDGVGLSSREIAFGLDLWQDVQREGLPILAANLFRTGSRSLLNRVFGGSAGKPLFTQCAVREGHDQTLAAIGFVSASAWNARKDTLAAVAFKSPFEMGKLIQSTARRCDHLTVIGEFTNVEAESLARAFPAIDLVVSSGIRTDTPHRVGETVIVGSGSRGYSANFVEWKSSVPGAPTAYEAKSQSLDPSVPEDSTTVRLLGRMNERIAAASQKK